jgi:hypothetical protein
MGNGHQPIAVRPPNGRVVRLAQAHRVSADGVEHGLNVGRRAGDDAEDRAGSHLLFQRLVKALLHLGI